MEALKISSIWSIIAVATFMFFTQPSHASNITVETYTLAGVASIAHQTTSGVDHVAVNIPGIGNLTECNALKAEIEASVIDRETSSQNGNVQPGLIRFSGFCVKVKQFVFAPNLF